MKAKLWSKGWRLLFLLVLSWGFSLSPQASQAAPKTYVDPHGFFSFTPPPGWTEKDYPGASVGRVRFTAPDRQATMSIIVMPAPPQEATFDKLLAAKQAVVAKMRQEKPQGKFTLQEDKICQFRCVRLDTVFPGHLVMENYLLVEQGLSVSLGYTAKNRENLDKYRQTALSSFCTIKLKGKQ